jgi:hypothetical protein
VQLGSSLFHNGYTYEEAMYWSINGANRAEGNIYANVMDGSVAVYGTANSSIAGLYIGALGAGYPYSNATSGGKFICSFAGCQDNAPLTPNIMPTVFSAIGNALSWVWGQLQAGDQTISGTPSNWTWRTWAPGSGRQVRNGTAANWTWVSE